MFSAGRMGMGYNTESFERVLKQEFGTEALVSDVSYPRFASRIQSILLFSNHPCVSCTEGSIFYLMPRVLITAVYKKTNQPELHLFSNCFDNEFSKCKPQIHPRALSAMHSCTYNTSSQLTYVCNDKVFIVVFFMYRSSVEGCKVHISSTSVFL